MAAQRAQLADGRLHLNHGPIDLIIEAFGPRDEVAGAYDQAWTSFGDILPGLTRELRLLRQPVRDRLPAFESPVARRMAEAVWPHRTNFITPMAAVAGAVADEMLAVMKRGRSLSKAYVNDGGDIAIYLSAGEKFTAGIVGYLWAPAIGGRAEIPAESPVRGIATSGQGGRSFSLGIADAVTVLARTAAEADAAATMIANAVSVDDPAIRRQPASAIDPDSDLGDIPVTLAVGILKPEAAACALDAGERAAVLLAQAGLIVATMLQLQGMKRIVTADGNLGSQISFDGGGNPPRGRPSGRPGPSPRGPSGRHP
jgi:ApbE superfamily uncharacterized protein (UPF0280 family)